MGGTGRSLTEVAAPAATVGLSTAEAQSRLQRDGPNRIPAPRPAPPLLQLGRQLTHFFALLLWAAAALAAVAGTWELAVAIVCVIVLNGVFAFAQEHRADQAAARLAAMLPARVTVRRDGSPLVVDADELVVGDRVMLEAGDRICADLILANVAALAVDESMLTGESAAVRLDRSGTAHAGTFVLEGRAEGDVVAVGPDTRLAAIAAQTRAAERPKSPLTIELNRVVRSVAAIAVAVGAVLFLFAMVQGVQLADGLVLGVGVAVALVPEGLLPTVTLSLARAAQTMASRHALVRRLEAVEVLGATTYVCSDKTGTLTRNEMTVVEVWTPTGTATILGAGYDPEGSVEGTAEVRAAVAAAATSALQCSTGRVVAGERGRWVPHGDPMEVALHVLALRAGVDVATVDSVAPQARHLPFDPRRRRESVAVAGELHVKGAPDAVLERCGGVPGASEAVERLAERGLRVLAVARRPIEPTDPLDDADQAERGLELLALVALQDPPRAGVADAIRQCRRAGVRVALITGDHPATARAIAAEVGLLTSESAVVLGAALPADDEALGALLDHDGTVVARVTPEDKLRIARALQRRGHIVAMTGDGVNDGPALRQADIGVAMGRSGTDVAREAADLVLLDDAFPTIVGAIELGRSTASNVRRFLTYHLTDNVAELTPFALFALTAGSLPLALTVLMVLALDIGTDLLPAVALGGEPPDVATLDQAPGSLRLVDGPLLRRAFLVLGPTEAVVEMVAFCGVLMAGGWRWGVSPDPDLLLTASGAAFAAVVLGQLANAFACRSDQVAAWRVPLLTNRLLLWAMAFELLTLAGFLWLPPIARRLELQPPSALGWMLAVLSVPAVLLVDASHKRARLRWRRRRGHSARPSAPCPAGWE